MIRNMRVLSTILVIAMPGLLQAQKVNAVLKKSADALGVNGLKAVRYTGSGSAGIFGQSFTPRANWPVLNVVSYSRTIDYEAMAFAEESTRTYQQPPERGGGVPFLKEQKVTAGVSGFPTALDQLDERHLLFLLTPHGFIRQALANTSTHVTKQKGGTAEVSFNIGKYTVTATIDAQGFIERIKTMVPNPVLGDMPIECLYSKYKDLNGIRFPSRIIQNSGGSMVLDISTSGIQVNPTDVTKPEFPVVLAQPAITVESKVLADHLWLLAGGSHNSLLVEFKEHVVVVDAPLNDARSSAVIAEVHKLVPGKPIRYIINTHHHFDHSGGLRRYVADGSIVVTGTMNVSFFEEAWSAPRTLTPDQLSQKPAKANFLAVADSATLSDETMTLKVFPNLSSLHNGAMLFIYLPREKVVFVADEYSQGRLVNGSMLPRARKFGETFVSNLERLQLDVERVVPAHGIVVSVQEMLSEIND